MARGHLRWPDHFTDTNHGNVSFCKAGTDRLCERAAIRGKMGKLEFPSCFVKAFIPASPLREEKETWL
ncbi:hypothetical protein AMECASPLE_025508 [Ameca splendens]|uniref:Uncharacterized protein n=1 Tax=Ameca splendens TaxID=208324 RepID=A0ABV0XHL8_9TELE